MKAENCEGQNDRIWRRGSPRCLATCALTTAGGLLGGFFLFPYVSRPSEADLLPATAAAYFQFVSEEGYEGAARYSDCRVEEASQRDADQLWVAFFGICSLSSGDMQVDFTVAFYKTGSIAFKDREVRRDE